MKMDEQPTELEKRIWKILDDTGMNPMLQPTTCDRILAVVNKLSKARVIESLPFCDDNSYGYDELGLCNDCGLEKKPNGNELYPVLGVVTSNEITSIDNRIKSCIIENPEEYGDEYYAKIWFSYKDNFGTNPDGRHEFIADTKQKLIDAIQDFMATDKDGWCIV